MVKLTLDIAVVKGFLKFLIRPPPSMSLPVTKEYGNKYDPNPCLVWVPELQCVSQTMRNAVSDAKQGEIVKHMAGLPIRRVPLRLPSCF